MLRKLSFAIAGILFVFSNSFGQGSQGELRGQVIDENGEGVPFASVVVELDGQQVGGTSTNFDGEFIIKPIQAGSYLVKASCVGYNPVEISNVIINAGKVTYLKKPTAAPIKLLQGIKLEEVVKIGYKVPLIDPDKRGATVTRDEISKMPIRGATAIASTTGGVASQDGEVGSIRGSRDGADVYVDGVRVFGSSSVPQGAIEEVQTIVSGVPAEYGDNTGGIINIITRGPSGRTAGGVEVVSSQLTDPYNSNDVNFYYSTPLWNKRDTAGRDYSVAGVFLSGQYVTIEEASPNAIGYWRLKDDVLADLEQNPLQAAPGGGTNKRSEFITADDIYHVKNRGNQRTNTYRFQSKFDFKTSDYSNLTIGGNLVYNDGFGNGGLFNYNTVSGGNATTFRTYGRFTQRFKNPEAQEGDEKKGGIRNAYYTLHFDYTKTLSETRDPNHGDNIFRYGYVGKFRTYTENAYAYGRAPGTNLIGNYHAAFRDTAFTFERAEFNPVTANYTSRFYEIQDQLGNDITSWTQVQNGGGLLNGASSNVLSVYSLYNNVGTPNGTYNNADNQYFRVNASGSADIGDHAIKLGFQYEQRSQRSYALAPRSLWNLMFQLANFHISDLDTNNAQPVYVDGVFQDVVNYPRKYVGEKQFWFDKQLRSSLGMAENSTEWIDVWSYDPETFSIDMFSADELLNDGNTNVAYYGYDHHGNKLTRRPTFADFFTRQDDDGNYTRDIPAFEPIYVAGYIQDKFDFDDIRFLVGLRVDRLDANQQQLKDPWLLYEGVTAGEVDANHPANIGDDYVVYVSDLENPKDASIVGYRKDGNWFDSQGNEVTNPLTLAEKTTTGKIAPYLIDPSSRITEDGFDPSGAFEDYRAQTNIMPRISFSFPVSDEANFFAHYDVLTKRPSALRLDPFDYMFIANNVGGILSNPGLQPEKTIDYEVGFQQVLSPSSSFTLSSYYREMRDMITLINVEQAYPVSYTTYGNLDFGTVKGFQIGYDLRRTKNIRFKVDYTLQFADGTGSGANSGISLIGTGQPNLRTIFPLDYDQRHSIVATVDYRYGQDKDYNGPVWFGKDFFQNTGVNFVFRGNSGRPYSKSANVTTIQSGVSQRSTLEGSINGSRNPWNFKIDLRLDRDIYFTVGKKDDKKKRVAMNAYLLVNNVLNTKNVLAVYRATGNPDDDGYLSSSQAQPLIEGQVNPQSFTDLYSIRMNNGGGYSTPRLVRLGFRVGF